MSHFSHAPGPAACRRRPPSEPVVVVPGGRVCPRVPRLPVTSVDGRLPDRTGDVALPDVARIVPGAVAGNLASLTGRGNPADSGISSDAARQAIAKAETAYQKPEDGVPKTDLSEGVQASLGLADTALQEHQDVSGKADKVPGATAGDFAGLDEHGNLADSGKKPADYEFESGPSGKVSDPWTCTPAATQYGTPFSVKWTTDPVEGEGWALFTGDTKQGKVLGDESSTELSWSQGAQTAFYDVSAVRQLSGTELHLKGQPDAKLQPAGDYASGRAMKTVNDKVVAVEDKIPPQASASNQLADKAFVNSSIATETATFRDTFNLVADLQLPLSATHEQVAAAVKTKLGQAAYDKNDYVFVQIPQDLEHTDAMKQVDRYKCVETGTDPVVKSWEYEWTLNNSSFTAAQWAAINSGITSGLVAKLGALPTAEALAVALAGKASTADATLTERGFTEWAILNTPLTPEQEDAFYYENPLSAENDFAVTIDGTSLYVGSYKVAGLAFHNDNLALTFVDGSSEARNIWGPNGTTVATCTALQGYQLGSQSDKPLASEAEAEALRTEVAGKVPTSRTINGKMLLSNVTLTGANIPVAATAGAKTIKAAVETLETEKADAELYTPTTTYPIGVYIQSDPTVENDIFAVSDGEVEWYYNKYSVRFADGGAYISCTYAKAGTILVRNRTTGAVANDINVPIFFNAGDVGDVHDGDEDLDMIFVVANATIAGDPARHTLVESIEARTNGKANKAPNPTAGNLAALDAQGNPTDSTIPAANVAVKGEIRYTLPETATAISSASSEVVSGETIYYGEATLADRTQNQVAVLVALDELRVTIPPAVSGKVRDFGLLVGVGLGEGTALAAPALVPIAPSGETIAMMNAEGEMPTLADGTTTATGMTVLYFTEVANGTFLVKGEQIQGVA